MTIKPHELFSLNNPDEVAECWEGVSRELYRTLWKLVELYPDVEPPETPDTFYGHVFGNELSVYWKHLTEAEQIELNDLAERRNDE